MPHSNASRQAKVAIRILRKHAAPDELINSFEDLLEINASCKYPASVRDLMVDNCKKFNFAEPFSMDGKQRQFRARLVDENSGRYSADCFDHKSTTAAEEQAYRRGFDQGFAEARRMVERGDVIEKIRKWEKAIHAWRIRPVQILGSSPGSDEDFDKCLVVPRGSISPRLRFKVFERDNFRCQICGRSQTSGVTLHADHKRSIADGGEDAFDNLQTLCAECNLGKSSSSMN